MPSWLNLFDTEGFPPRWHCGTAWGEEPGWGWLHIISDIAIWGAYTTIPLVLVFLVLRRRGVVPFQRVFWLFGAFILACGTTHLIDASLFYWPAYRLSGVAKLLTASVSWATVIALTRVVPTALTLRSPAELDQEVAARTRELEELNEKLQAEIRARKQAQNTLVEHDRQLQLALSAGGMGVWRWDLTTDTLELDVPLCALLGVASNQEIPTGHAFFARLHPADRDVVRARVVRAAEDETSFESEFRIVLPDGSIRWLAGLGLRVKDVQDNGTHMVGVNYDISTRKQLEEDLSAAMKAADRSSQAKGEFLANMSHEIRTPLTVILGYIDILERQVKDPAQRECVETIGRNGNFLLEVVNDVLDLSKIEAGKVEIHLTRFRIDEFLIDVIELIKIRAEKKGLPIKLEFDGLICETIESDAKRLRQILINLLSNAIKFTDSGQVSLHVKLLNDEQLLQLRVIDTGIGIAPEQQAKIFQPYAQAEAGDVQHDEGSGLGLVITRRLARMLGGEIHVESELGNGSTFTVTVATGDLDNIPLVEGQTKRVLVSRAESDNPQLDCSVLVVDDRREVLFLAERFIAEAGGSVTTAVDGQQALDVVAAAADEGKTFDIILMDMEMPVLDGFRATEKLRQSGFQGPIVALTAHAFGGYAEKCRASGCDDYITKPISRALLIETIVRHTSGQASPLQGKASANVAVRMEQEREEVELPAGKLPTPHTTTAASQSSKRVLVIDDNIDVCRATTLLLETRGHNVRYACDGQSGMEVAKVFHPEAVLLDLGLPDMSGYEAIANLRKIEELRKAVLIAVTGRLTPDDLQRASAAGFDHYVVKPADLEQLDKYILGQGKHDVVAQAHE